MTEISIVMATYNTSENFLRASIESILNQSFKDFEFIIIDDCSTGSDREIVLTYRDNRIKLLSNSENKGLAASLNIGIKEASGKYIARMDADDISLPMRLKEQYNYLINHTEIDIISTYAKKMGEKNGYIISPTNSTESVDVHLFFGNVICHPTVMMKKEFLENNNLLYDERLKSGQDYELWSRSLMVGKINIIPKVLLYYRIHGKQISKTKKNEQMNNTYNIYKQQIMNLGIPATDREVQIHYELINDNTILISNGIEQLFAWKTKLKKANDFTGRYNRKTFELYLNYILFKKILRLTKKSSTSNLSLKSKLTYLLDWNSFVILFRYGRHLIYSKFINCTFKQKLVGDVNES